MITESYIATAVDPIHHGAGNVGNTATLRKQDIVLPNGRLARVPFVSGNSLKHRIRESAVAWALEALEVQQGELTKPIVHLLFSGGQLTKSGTVVDLALQREIESLFPALSLCGYSAGNMMTTSKLWVDHMHLICRENQFRMPAALADAEEADRPASRASYFLSEDFGTRHNPMKNASVSGLVAVGIDGGDESVQMIYDFEVINPGARFWGSFHLRDVTDGERAAYTSAWRKMHLGDNTYTIGAKSSIGYGRLRIKWIADDGETSHRELDDYRAHLVDHRTEIMQVLKRAVQ